MEQLIVTTNTLTDARFLAVFLQELKTVKSVCLAKSDKNSKSIAEKYDWINPSRSATEEEIEQMLDECEKSPIMTAGEAEEYSINVIHGKTLK